MSRVNPVVLEVRAAAGVICILKSITLQYFFMFMLGINTRGTHSLRWHV
jgi:hypothetical protein